jgi:malate dehydrogenase
MDVVAIVGAGDLGAALARKLADREAARHIALIDPDEGRARGKALDLMQSGPVEASDTRLSGHESLEAAARAGHGTWDALVLADGPALGEDAPSALRLADLIRDVRPFLEDAPLVVAGPRPAAVVETAVASGIARELVLGSAAVVWSAALRRALADELGADVSSVAATTFGLPPNLVASGVVAGGLGQEALPSAAVHRALDRLRGRRHGPEALAAAAAAVLCALQGAREALLPVVAVLGGEFGITGRALSVPARVARGRLQRIQEFSLDPKSRVAFENAAAHALAARP